MYLDDYKNNPKELDRKFAEYQNTKARPNRYKAVVGRNIQNGDISEYKAAYHAKKDGFNPSHIIGCCSGKRKTHKGYIWYYKD